MARVILMALLAQSLLSCGEQPLSVPPTVPGPTFQIQDAVHNAGNTHFFFLPPLVPQPQFTGVFDATQSPAVTLCRWTGTACGPLVAQFSMTSGTGSQVVRVDLAGQAYSVNWDSNQCIGGRCGFAAGDVLRLRVWAAGAELGWVDVQLVANAQQARQVDNNQFVQLVIGKPLTIKFRIEEGALCSATRDCAQAWLATHPRIAAAIVWVTPTGDHPYADWSAVEKDELEGYFIGALNGGVSLSDPAENLIAGSLADDDRVWTIISADAARQLYLATVGHSLAMEWSGQLGWSLTGYSDADLWVLLDSRAMFFWENNSNGTGISGYALAGGCPQVHGFCLTHGFTLPAPPSVAYGFLKQHNLIAADPRGTIDRVIDWGRGELAHFFGGASAQNFEDHWQYRGAAPVSRILTGTANSAHPEWGVHSWTPGCHGTNSFLMNLLRAVNIPVQFRVAQYPWHATPYFSGEGMYLSHGDDIYDIRMHITTTGQPIPSHELLISQAQWDAWFGPSLTWQESLLNVGRRVTDLSVIYLPDFLLSARCQDIQSGATHAASLVYRWLDPNLYSVEDLEAVTLWERLDEKIASLGGCTVIPQWPY